MSAWPVSKTVDMSMSKDMMNRGSSATAAGHVVIDIEAMKTQRDSESLQYYIWSVALNCKKSSRAFWALERSLRFKDRLVSIPLLILSSATGLASVTMLQQQQQQQTASADAMVALGVSSACLVAIQKFTRYAERAAAAKHVAKSYARIARRIETTMVLVESSAVSMDAAVFLQFVKDMEKELDAILCDTDEIPDIAGLDQIRCNRRGVASVPISEAPVVDVDVDEPHPFAATYASQDSLRSIKSQVHAMMFKCADESPPPRPPNEAIAFPEIATSSSYSSFK